MILKWIEKKAFAKGLTNTQFFRDYVRRFAYRRAGGDPERVHEMALEKLQEYEDVIQERFHDFLSPELDILKIEINGRRFLPFGTAAGLDKNADAVEPLSYIFGFQEVGTIIVNPREGNKRPRVAVDERNGDLFNAQGFPSKGLRHARYNIFNYRKYRGGNGAILGSICGIPPGPEELDVAFEETELLLTELDSLVDGFVWNPFSPNTAALTALRTPETFEKYAKLVKQTAGNRWALVKMGPYDNKPEKREQWLDLVSAWIRGGGDGIVAVNTYMVPKDKVPSKDWGYPSAGRSGRFLQPYRQQAILSVRRKFPDAVIIAAGGIDSPYQAWSAFEAGADALEGYTPYTFHGFGLLREIVYDIRKKLYLSGRTFQEWRKEIKERQTV